jgi:dTDP-glucose 4,6-dehydratase
VTVRPFNTYGPRQSTRAVIPTIITQALSNSEIKLGNLHSSRDFTFISDTVEGILKSTATPNVEGKTFNLGSGDEITIGELAKKIAKVIGKQVNITLEEKRLRPEKSEVNQLISDNRLALKELNWHPSTDLDTGLEETVHWYKKNIDRFRFEYYSV